MKVRVSSRAKLTGSERKQDGIEPAACIDGMGGMMQQAQEKGSRWKNCQVMNG
jgi:hypothetical protein